MLADMTTTAPHRGLEQDASKWSTLESNLKDAISQAASTIKEAL